MIRSQDAMFIWNEDSDGLVERIAIVDFSDPPLTPEEERAVRQQDWEYYLSHGACCMGWMEAGRSFNYTPEGLFAQLALRGFASAEAFHATIAAFAECDTCEWARQIKADPDVLENEVLRRLHQMGRSQE